jgi:hypothetical protein
VQAGTAMLAQANSLPNTVLSLLEAIVAQGPQEAGASPPGFASLLQQRCSFLGSLTGMFAN